MAGCCQKRANAQNPAAPHARSSNAGTTPYPHAGGSVRTSNAGRTPFPTRGKKQTRKTIQLHVFCENAEGGGEYEPIDQSPPARRPEQEMAKEYVQAMAQPPCSPCRGKGQGRPSNLIAFPETPSRQPVYQGTSSGEVYSSGGYTGQTDNSSDWETITDTTSPETYCSDATDFEDDYEDEFEEVLLPFRIELKNLRRKKINEQNESPILTFNPTQNGVAVKVKTFPPDMGYGSEDDVPPMVPRRLDFGSEASEEYECEDQGTCGKPTCKGPSARRN